VPGSDIAAKEIHALYADHNTWLRGWLRRKLGNASDAADIAHDTFLRLLIRQRPVTRPGLEPRALLAHVAKGLLVDHWRRRSIEQAYLETLAQLPEPQSPGPEERLLILEALYRIDAMLHTLPRRTRDIFLLVQLDGLNYQQVADRLNMALITVKRHMRKAFLACLALD